MSDRKPPHRESLSLSEVRQLQEVLSNADENVMLGLLCRTDLRPGDLAQLPPETEVNN